MWATPRLWSDAEVALIDDVAARMWQAVARARAKAGLLPAIRRKDQFYAPAASRLAQVSGPTLPFGKMPDSAWKARTAASVLRPK